MKTIFFFILLVITTTCYSQVTINEIQSSNSSTIADNYGEYEDWIEIYNPNDFQVDIGGFVLKDNVDTWQIPKGDTSTILAPHGYFLLWADDEEHQGKFHTNFKLSASNGEFLGIYKSDSVTLIESVQIPPLSANKSYGKCLDEKWTIITDPTPLEINTCQISSIPKTTTNNTKIYPVVSDGKISIKLPENTNETVDLFLYSINGKLVLSKKYTGSSITLYTNTLKPELHLIKIRTSINCYFGKVMITE